MLLMWMLRHHDLMQTQENPCFLEFFKNVMLIFLCVLACCLHICLCVGVGSPGTKVTSRCEVPFGCWKLNPGPLEEQPVLLTAKPSLQPLLEFLKF